MALHTPQGEVLLERCLFDSGALCQYSLVSTKVIERLRDQAVQMQIRSVNADIHPFTGAAITAEGLVSLTMSVVDVMNIAHVATFECLIVPFKSFDVIVNNATCRLKFARFFYNADNFVVIQNPFKTEHCEEELVDLVPDPYGHVTDVLAVLAEMFPQDNLVGSIEESQSFEAQVEDKLAEFAVIKESISGLAAFRELLTNNAAVFQLTNIGIRSVLVNITTASHLPQEIVAKVRPIRRDLLPLVEKELRQFTELQLHELCESPYAAPIVPVKKADGTVRIAIDYSVGINQYITMPSIPIPLIRDILMNLSRFPYFFEIDLSKAYRQLRLTEESSKLLAYVTPIGQFRPLTLPEGVRTAPQLFSQVMYTILRTKYKFGTNIEYYFDNVYGGSDTPEELLELLSKVIRMCATENIKLKLSKCTFITTCIKALGYIVKHGAVEVDPDRVASLLKLRAPRNKQELRSVLGSFLLCSYYVPNYAFTASPLYELLKNDMEFIWSDREDAVFTQLKTALTSAVSITYPDYSKMWILRTDGSKLGIGGCLVQVTTHEDGTFTEEIIAMLSKKLSEPAQRWSIYEIELYSLIYCVKTWSTLLYGKAFIAQVDHRNLSYLQQSTLAKVHRWRLFLSDFEFSLQIIPGKSNIIADMLSRVLETNDETQVHGVWTILTEEYLQQSHRGLGDVSHYPVYRMYELVSKDLDKKGEAYRPRELLEKIRHTVNTCGFCNKERLTAKAEVKRYRSMMFDEPFSMIGLDLVGAFTADVLGYTHILVIRDFFDRVVDLTAIKGKDSKAYLSGLLKYAATFGIPRYVRTDNGAEFTNNLVQEFNALLKISQTFTTAYTPSGNSMTERVNKEFVPQLRMYVQHQNISAYWSTYLPVIQCNINNSFNRIIGMSPFRLRFGDRASLYPKITDIDTSSADISDKFVKALAMRLGIVRQIAIIISDAELAYLLSRQPEYTNITVDDYVVVEQYNNFTRSAPSKLEPRLKGPYKVVEVLNGNLFRCQHLTSDKEETFDISHLHKFDQTGITEVIDSVAEEIFVPDTIKNKHGKAKAKRQSSKTPSSSSNKVETIPVETRQTNRIRRPPIRFTS